jgi:prolyl-tRNA editing enzyme YbaK/EbsC (Cys-tRNA(Pro) deacylase)
LTEHFGVGKKQIKLTDAETVLQILGYTVGGVPPFGHTTAVPVLLDRSVLAWDVVYGGGGDDHTLLRIAPEELARATKAEWIELETRR